MLGAKAREIVSKVTHPLAKVLIHLKVSANAMTVIGMVLSTAAAIWFFPRGQLFWGTMLIWLFVMFDMVDGAIAREEGGGTIFGAVLDSVCDRISDGAVFASLAYWAATGAHNRMLLAVLLAVGVFAQAISYCKARAQSCGISVEGGALERTERLIIILVGSGLEGLGLSGALFTASIILLVGTIITLLQRIWIVAQGAKEIKHTI